VEPADPRPKEGTRAVSWFQAVVYGLVQALTEFLPVSSTAHVRLVAAFADWDDPGAAFTAVTQLGTLVAVLAYFRNDIWAIVRTWTHSLYKPELRGELDARMGWYVILGTLPIGVLGLVFQDTIENTFRSLWLIAATLIGFGLVIGFADARARNVKALEQLTLRDGLAFGCAQALALVPGVSRAGGTISAGLLLGYRREAAARYSFLLSIPAVLVSGLFELKDIGGTEHPVDWAPTIVATIIAFASGLAVIHYFLRYVSTHSFRPFVVYRIILGLVLVGLLASGVIEA